MSNMHDINDSAIGKIKELLDIAIALWEAGCEDGDDTLSFDSVSVCPCGCAPSSLYDYVTNIVIKEFLKKYPKLNRKNIDRVFIESVDSSIITARITVVSDERLDKLLDSLVQADGDEND